MIRFYEWAAGKLLVRSAKARAHRLGPDDAHELRHLGAALMAGNSSPCEDGRCHLDRENPMTDLTSLAADLHERNDHAGPVCDGCDAMAAHLIALGWTHKPDGGQQP